MLSNRWPCEQGLLGVFCLRRYEYSLMNPNENSVCFRIAYFSVTVIAEFVIKVFHFSVGW